MADSGVIASRQVSAGPLHDFSGDGPSMDAVWHRCEAHLRLFVRRRLTAELQSRADVDDVLQSTFRSLFVRAAAARVEARSWASLWKLLEVIASRKCARQAERHLSARRDVRRQVSWDEASNEHSQSDQGESPYEAVAARETVAMLFAPMDDPRQRKILAMRLDGYSISEISRTVQRAERTVNRVLERARERLLKLQQVN